LWTLGFDKSPPPRAIGSRHRHVEISSQTLRPWQYLNCKEWLTVLRRSINLIEF
jgi:hypothetical protein